jgi:hypothetical protein
MGRIDRMHDRFLVVGWYRAVIWHPASRSSRGERLYFRQPHVRRMLVRRPCVRARSTLWQDHEDFGHSPDGHAWCVAHESQRSDQQCCVQKHRRIVCSLWSSDGTWNGFDLHGMLEAVNKNQYCITDTSTRPSLLLRRNTSFADVA